MKIVSIRPVLRYLARKSLIFKAFRDCFLAEEEGFEPPDAVKHQRFSRPPRSTALPFLRESED